MMVRLAILSALLAVSMTALSAQNGARTSHRVGSIAGRVIQSDGLAAQGARVAVYAIRDGAPAAIVGTATSSYDGRYEVTGLPPGQFAVGVTPQRAQGFGGDSRRLTSKPVETLYPGVTDRTQARPVTLFDGVPSEGIDIWLAPAAQRYSISGRVYWPDNAAVSNLVIEYGGRGEVQHGVWYVSDPGGLFTIESVSEGTYVLHARGDTADGPLIGVASTEVSNDAVQDLRVMLRAPGSVQGRLVVDGPGGPAVSALRVVPVQTLLTLSPLYPAEEAAVDGGGFFTLAHLTGEYAVAVHGLPPGWRVRRVTRAGGALPDQHVIVRPGEHVTAIEVTVSR